MENVSVISESSKRSNLYPIIIIGSLFFVFGFITWVNSVLIPYLKIACELNNLQSYMVAFAFYIAYFVMAIPSGNILQRTGYKKGMALGLVIIAVGALVFIPAAITRLYNVFLFGLFIQGTGLALLQTASNPYITVLGPPESAARRISIMGICNKCAGAMAPIILGAVALKDVDGLLISLVQMTEAEKESALDMLALRVVTPYVVITVLLLLLAAFVFFSRLPDFASESSASDKIKSASRKTLLQFPHLLLGATTLFFYVGVEVLAGDSIIAYASAENIPLASAKFFTACTMGAMIVGYLIGVIMIPRYLSQHKALLFSSVLGIALSIVVVATNGYTSVLALALLGLANALVWPAVWPLALNGLGNFTKRGASLLIMGIAGGAVIPLLYGRLADLFSNRTAYLILLPCYFFIFYYAKWGSKVRSEG